MASFRPVSRLLARQLNHITSISKPTHTSHAATSYLFRPTSISITSKSHFHTTRIQQKRDPVADAVSDLPDDSKGSSDRPLVDPGTNNAYPDGPPGRPKPGESLSSGIEPSKIYDFKDIQSIASEDPSSRPHRILIDVREPGELLDTGRIPGALNIPIKTAPDAFFMSAEDFEDKFGFARPGKEDEVIFYCKAGVRSKAAARLAGQSGFGEKFGEFPGSMDAWISEGGKIQRE